MGILVDNSAFTGNWALPQTTGVGSSGVELVKYITQYERRYLYDLFGKPMAEDFITYVANPNPARPEYDVLLNAMWEDVNECVYRTEGMLKMMLGFIYWEYVRGTKVRQTETGGVVSRNENSREADFVEQDIYRRYNESVKDYKTIQKYCRADKTTYPDFKGECKGIALPF